MDPAFLKDPVEFARLLGLIVPLAVALVTKKFAPSALKSVLNVALAAVAATVATVVGVDGGWDWNAFFDAWLNAFVVGIVAYYGALKPMGIADSVIDATSRFGVGSDEPPSARHAA